MAADDFQTTEKLFVFICKGDACTKKGNPDRAKVALKQLSREYPAQALKVSFVSCLGMCGEGPNILLCRGGKVLSHCSDASMKALEDAVRRSLGDAP